MSDVRLTKPAQDQSSGSGHTVTTSRHPYITDPIASKRICFYKSGDPQFSGLRMVINNRTFKTFDALLDSLSKKVPLPFGVRNITTPRGVHAVHTLDELEDGKAYICSDQRKVKPINMAVASKKLPPWYNARPMSARRRALQLAKQNPGRPMHKNIPFIVHTPKRLMVFRNGDPSVKHNLMLQKRTTPTFEALLDYMSELMHFPVVKLHTPDGRRVDGLPALILCSGIVVAAGREAFKSGNYKTQKSSAPTWLPARRLASKRLKHPASRRKKPVSSGKSQIFSPSSERYFVNQINHCIAGSQFEFPSNNAGSVKLEAGHFLETDTDTYHGDRGEVAHNCTPGDDDIEKSFQVNQDGSMTVEMKVRLTIREEETIHWTTTLSRSSVANQLKSNILQPTQPNTMGTINGYNAKEDDHDDKDDMSPDDHDDKDDMSPDDHDDKDDMSPDDHDDKDDMSPDDHDDKDDMSPDDHDDKDDMSPDASRLTSVEVDNEDGAKTHVGEVFPRRAPTPEPRRYRQKQASGESIKTMLGDEIQENMVGSNSYRETTENGEVKEEYSTVRQCKPVPKPRGVGSVDINNYKKTQSTFKSGAAETLLIQNVREEVIEGVMHIYEQQTCHDNFLPNSQYSVQGVSMYGMMYGIPATSDTARFSSSNDLELELGRPSTASKSISGWRADQFKAGGSLLNNRVLNVHKTPLSKPTKYNDTPEWVSEASKENSTTGVKKVKRMFSKPKVKKNQVRKSTIPDKRRKESNANASEHNKRVKTVGFSSNVYIRKIYGPKPARIYGLKPARIYGPKPARIYGLKPARSLIRNKNKPKGKEIKLNIKTPKESSVKELNVSEHRNKTSDTVKKNVLHVSFPMEAQVEGPLKRQRSMHEERRIEKESHDLSASMSLPAPSNINEYVENWLEKALPAEYPDPAEETQNVETPTMSPVESEGDIVPHVSEFNCEMDTEEDGSSFFKGKTQIPSSPSLETAAFENIATQTNLALENTALPCPSETSSQKTPLHIDTTQERLPNNPSVENTPFSKGLSVSPTKIISVEKPSPSDSRSLEETSIPTNISEEKPPITNGLSLENKSLTNSSSIEKAPVSNSLSSEKTPLPAKTQIEKTPLPAKTQTEKTPLPAKTQTEKTPLPAKTQTEKTPLPAKTQTEKTPLPAKTQTEKTPLPAKTQTEKTPLPAKTQTEKTPLPAKTQTEKTPLPAKTQTEKTPLSNKVLDVSSVASSPSYFMCSSPSSLGDEEQPLSSSPSSDESPSPTGHVFQKATLFNHSTLKEPPSPKLSTKKTRLVSNLSLEKQLSLRKASTEKSSLSSDPTVEKELVDKAPISNGLLYEKTLLLAKTLISNNVLDEASLASSPSCFMSTSPTGLTSDERPVSICPSSEEALSPTGHVLEKRTLFNHSTMKGPSTPKLSMKKTRLISNLSLEKQLSLRRASVEKSSIPSNTTLEKAQLSNPVQITVGKTQLPNSHSLEETSLPNESLPSDSTSENTQLSSSPQLGRTPLPRHFSLKTSLHNISPEITTLPTTLVMRNTSAPSNLSSEMIPVPGNRTLKNKLSPYSQSLEIVSPPMSLKTKKKPVSRNQSLESKPSPVSPTLKKTPLPGKSLKTPISPKSTPVHLNSSMKKKPIPPSPALVNHEETNGDDKLSNSDQGDSMKVTAEEPLTKTQIPSHTDKLTPQPDMKPVLEKLCFSIQSIRQITHNNRLCFLEKSNSLPDFSFTSTKALLSLLSVITLKERFTNWNIPELNANSVSCAEALKIKESLREIASIEDVEELKASLSALQKSTSTLLLQSWKGFQELNNVRSRSSTLNSSEHNVLFETLPEEDYNIEEKALDIDELIHELDLPEKLKEALAALPTRVSESMEGNEIEMSKEANEKVKSSPDERANAKSTAVPKEETSNDTVLNNDANVDVKRFINIYPPKEVTENKMSPIPEGQSTRQEQPFSSNAHVEQEIKCMELQVICKESLEEVQASSEEEQEFYFEDQLSHAESENKCMDEECLEEEESHEDDLSYANAHINKQDEQTHLWVQQTTPKEAEYTVREILPSLFKENSSADRMDNDSGKNSEQCVSFKQQADTAEEANVEDNQCSSEEKQGSYEETLSGSDVSVEDEPYPEEWYQETLEEESSDEGTHYEKTEEKTTNCFEEPLPSVAERVKLLDKKIVDAEQRKSITKETAGIKPSDQVEVPAVSGGDGLTNISRLSNEQAELDKLIGESSETHTTNDVVKDVNEQHKAPVHTFKRTTWPINASEPVVMSLPAPRSSSLAFSYDGCITREPDGNRVKSLKVLLTAKSGVDIQYGQTRRPSPNTSDLYDNRPETADSGGHRSQTPTEASSGEDNSVKKPITKGVVRRTIERLYGKKDTNVEDPARESQPPSLLKPKSRELPGKTSLSPLHNAQTKVMSDLSYFNATSYFDTYSDPMRCIAFNAQVGPGDCFLIDKDRLLLRESMIRKYVSETIDINKNTPASTEDMCKDTKEDVPYSLFGQTDLEDVVKSLKPLVPKCTYFNLPHGCDSDPHQDYLSPVREGSAEGDISKDTKAKAEKPKLWAEKNGTLAVFAPTDFKIADNKVHPLIEGLGGGKVVVQPGKRQPGKGQTDVKKIPQEPDALEMLYFTCGQHCPIL